MIEATGLSKAFGDIHALNDVSFRAEKGQIVGFLGANGAGKTTTMDIICGCLGADAGSVKVAGYDIMDAPIDAKRRLGYLPDVPPLHGDMRVHEYIDYAARLHKVPSREVRSKVDRVMDKLSLGEVRNRIVGNLSKGFRQRVGLAQALVHDPDVLVLDEPTEGLDPNQIVHIRELIRSLAGQHTILLSSHILSEVQATCDHIVIIHKGRVVQQGTYDELVTHLESGRVFRLRVARNVEKLAGDLKSIAGISGLQVIAGEDQTLEFHVTTAPVDPALDEVARRVLSGSYGIREMALKTKTLEEIFFQLTK